MMKKWMATLLSVVVLTGLFAGCGGEKGKAIELAFKKEDVKAVVVLSGNANAADPDFKIVMNEDDIGIVYSTAGKVRYNPESDFSNNENLDQDGAEMTVFVFMMQDGSSNMFAYIENGDTKGVVFDDSNPTAYEAYGGSPKGIVAGLANDSEKAFEEGIDLTGALMALGEI